MPEAQQTRLAEIHIWQSVGEGKVALLRRHLRSTVPQPTTLDHTIILRPQPPLVDLKIRTITTILRSLRIP